jgi:threonyl-tRNA synthetase
VLPAGARITVRFDGKSIDVAANEVSPLSLAVGEGAGPSSDGGGPQPFLALVNGEAWDLSRPLEQDCDVGLVGFEHPIGKATFWHSSAHVLGQALELYFGGKGLTVHLRDGPALDEGGFFYDFLVKDKDDASVTVSADELEAISAVMSAIVKAKQPFERRVVSAGEAAAFFAENPLKQAMLANFPATDVVTLYKSGALVDLCRGPHVPHTGHVKALKLTKTAGNVRKGEGETLQRVYGMAFPDKGLLKEWKKQQELAAKIDHRTLGPAQVMIRTSRCCVSYRHPRLHSPRALLICTPF